jgi:hypothetical protein
MYAGFLEEAGYEESALAAEASDRWTKLAIAAREASEPEEPDAAQWDGLSSEAGRVRESEERLWTTLAERS